MGDKEHFGWPERGVAAALAFCAGLGLTVLAYPFLPDHGHGSGRHEVKLVPLTPLQQAGLEKFLQEERLKRPCTKEDCPGRTVEEELVAAFVSGDCNWINGAMPIYDDGPHLTPEQDARYEELGCGPEQDGGDCDANSCPIR